MIIRKIAIYDKDTEYAMNLTEYITENKSIEYEVYVFSQVHKLELFVEDEQPDIVLADEEAIERLRERVDAWSIKQVLVFCEDRSKEKDGVSIYKYQEVMNIVHAIEKLLLYKKEDEEKCETDSRQANSIKADEEFKVVMITAPAYPTDAGNIALGINSYYKNSYLLVESDVVSILFEATDDKKLSEAMYILKSESLGSTELRECVCNKNGCDYISGVNSTSDTEEISEKEFEKLIRFAKEEGYKGLIFICDVVSAMNYNRLIKFNKMIVLEGGGKRVRDYTFAVIKGLNRNGENNIKLINTDSIRDKYLNQVVDYSAEEYKKGGLYRIVNEICRKD